MLARPRRPPRAARRRRAARRSGASSARAAHTANTIGRPVRSRQSSPRSWCARRILERRAQRVVADQQPRVGRGVLGHERRLGQQHAAERGGRRRLRGGGDRPHALERQVGDRAAPSRRHRRSRRTATAAARSRSGSAAYSMLEQFATSISPARSMRLSAVGTPVTSTASPSGRWRLSAHSTG